MSKRVLTFSDGFESSEEPNAQALDASEIGTSTDDNVQEALDKKADQTSLDDTNNALNDLTDRVDDAENDIAALEDNDGNADRIHDVSVPAPTEEDDAKALIYDHDTGEFKYDVFTASQVGNDTAQWNADKLQGIDIDDNTPSTGQALVYDGDEWSFGNPAADVSELPDMPEVAIDYTQRSVDYDTDDYVPIVASGSGTGGEWIRYADGTQIVRQPDITVTDQAIDSSYGSIGWFIGSRSVSFPVSFISPPSVTVPFARWGTGASFGFQANSASNTGCVLRFTDATSRASGTNFTFSYIAVGRWK